MADERSTIKIHVLHCGSMLVSKSVPYGGGVNLKNARRGVFREEGNGIALEYDDEQDGERARRLGLAEALVD